MSYDAEYHKEYRIKNKQRIQQKDKLWRKNNPDKVKFAHEKQKKSGYIHNYLLKYRKGISCKFSSLRSRAKIRKIKFEISKQDFTEWFNAQPKCCHYCKIHVFMGSSNFRKQWLTIDRIDNSLPYTLHNIVISCYRCNLLKSDDISYETMIEIGNILKKEKFGKIWNGEDWIKD